MEGSDRDLTDVKRRGAAVRATGVATNRRQSRVRRRGGGWPGREAAGSAHGRNHREAFACLLAEARKTERLETALWRIHPALTGETIYPGAATSRGPSVPACDFLNVTVIIRSTPVTPACTSPLGQVIS